MATDNRLRAKVPPSHSECITTFAEDRFGGSETEAERALIKEGLAAEGYLERPTDRAELFLWYVRRIGLILGFVGLISIGYGVFGSRLFSIIGFGLTLGGFLMVALTDGLDAFGRRREGAE